MMSTMKGEKSNCQISASSKNQSSTLGFEKIALLHSFHIPLTTNK
jgi:hypothetical protein